MMVIVLVVVAAFAAGVVDAIGGGGGLITLPALLTAGLPVHVALGTNKGQSSFGAIASFATFWKNRGIDRNRAVIGFVGGFVGSALGALALLSMRPEPLRPVVLVLLIAAAIFILVRKPIANAEPRIPRYQAAVILAIGLGFGSYDGFFGPGVGSMLIVAFTIVFGDTLTRASGNAKVVNLASNLAALVIFSWRGTIDWHIAAPMAVANMIGARAGAKLALRGGDKLVRWVVLGVVIAVVLKLGTDWLRS